jgi:hypothetical protein
MMNQCMASMKMNTIKEKSNQSSPQLVKTRMCKFNLRGNCGMGSACGFAHSKEELKPLPDFSRTRLCQVFIETGQCNIQNCSYAHTTDELVTGSSHKTKLCRFWQIGKCNLGNTCRFAHYADELKKPDGVTGKPQQQDQQHINPMAKVTGKPQQQDRQYTNSMAVPVIFDISPMQAPYPVTPHHLISNGQEYDLPDKMELTRGISASTQDSDGLKSYSNFSDDSGSEVESAPSPYGACGEGQEHFQMVSSMWHLPVVLGRVQQPSAFKMKWAQELSRSCRPHQLTTPLPLL